MEMKLRGFIHKIVSAVSSKIGKSAPSPPMRSSKVVVAPLHNRSHIVDRVVATHRVMFMYEDCRRSCDSIVKPKMLTPKPAAKSRSVNNG